MNLPGKISGTTASLITIGVGLWHFFIPSIWKWYSYFTENSNELITAIRAINFFFSLCLVLMGSITILFIWHKEIQIFYLKSLLTGMIILWAARVIMQVIYPQGSASALLQYSMLSIFIITLVLFIVSMFSFK